MSLRHLDGAGGRSESARGSGNQTEEGGKGRAWRTMWDEGRKARNKAAHAANGNTARPEARDPGAGRGGRTAASGSNGGDEMAASTRNQDREEASGGRAVRRRTERTLHRAVSEPYPAGRQGGGRGQEGQEGEAAGSSGGRGRGAGGREEGGAPLGGDRGEGQVPGEGAGGGTDPAAPPPPPEQHAERRPDRAPLGRPAEDRVAPPELVALPDGRVACPWCPAGKTYNPGSGFVMHLTAAHQHVRIDKAMRDVLWGLGRRGALNRPVGLYGRWARRGAYGVVK